MYETGFSYTFKSMKKQETLFYLLINRQVPNKWTNSAHLSLFIIKGYLYDWDTNQPKFSEYT